MFKMPNWNLREMKKLLILSDGEISEKIFLLRGKKVMLDFDLAELYDVVTGNLNRAVKRNGNRFPSDFMFQLTKKEYNSLRFQFGILKKGQHSKYLPYAFTEQGVAMLSSVLKSETAVQVNIQIIRVFSKMRELMLTHKDILLKLEQLEKNFLKQDKKVDKHEEEIQLIFSALKQLLEQPKPERKRVGFRTSVDKD
jgi:phage regulator Rha-like protein